MHMRSLPQRRTSMLKQVARSFFGALTLFVVLAGSSAFAANVLHPARGPALRHEGNRREVIRGVDHKRGVRLHRRFSRKTAVVASTVLLGDTDVEPQSDFLAAGRAEAFSLRANVSGIARTVHIYIDTANAARSV